MNHDDFMTIYCKPHYKLLFRYLAYLISDPTTYRNFALSCKLASEFCLEFKAMKMFEFRKPLTFTEGYGYDQYTIITHYLPNGNIQGLQYISEYGLPSRFSICYFENGVLKYQFYGSKHPIRHTDIVSRTHFENNIMIYTSEFQVELQSIETINCITCHKCPYCKRFHKFDVGDYVHSYNFHTKKFEMKFFMQSPIKFIRCAIINFAKQQK